MEVIDAVELSSFEFMDKEPYHYMAFYKNTGSTYWCGYQAYPATDKEALIRSLHVLSGVEQVRIYKVRLPIG
jgi:hypothetical protein